MRAGCAGRHGDWQAALACGGLSEAQAGHVLSHHGDAADRHADIKGCAGFSGLMSDAAARIMRIETMMLRRFARCARRCARRRRPVARLRGGVAGMVGTDATRHDDRVPSRRQSDGDRHDQRQRHPHPTTPADRSLGQVLRVWVSSTADRHRRVDHRVNALSYAAARYHRQSRVGSFSSAGAGAAACRARPSPEHQSSLDTPTGVIR